MAAVGDIAICNSGLIKIGARRISSFDEGSKEAKLCKEQYDKLRDAALEAHPWKFAIKRAELSKLVTTPAFEWDNEFQLPVDCLRVIYMEDRREKFTIEGDKLLTNAAEAKVKYISKVTNPDLFGKMFKEYLAHLIASEFSYPLVQSVSLGERIFAKTNIFTRDTRSSDSQQGTPDNFTDDVWLDSRL